MANYNLVVIAGTVDAVIEDEQTLDVTIRETNKPPVYIEARFISPRKDIRQLLGVDVLIHGELVIGVTRYPVVVVHRLEII